MSPFAIAFVVFLLALGGGRGFIYGNNSDIIQDKCKMTLYPRLCESSLRPYATQIAKANNPELEVVKSSIRVSSHRTEEVIRLVMELQNKSEGVVADCNELLHNSESEICDSLHALNNLRFAEFIETMDDVITWLSASLTDQVTCLDELQVSAKGKYNELKESLMSSSRVLSNSLALSTNFALPSPVTIPSSSIPPS